MKPGAPKGLRPFRSTTCIIVGKYRLERYSENQIWIGIVDDGEGGAFDDTELEAALDKFYAEHF